MDKQSLINTRDFMNAPAAVPAPVMRPMYSAEPQSGSVLDYWHAIYRRKLPLAICGVVGLALGLGFAVTQTPMYRASTSIEIQDDKDNNIAAKILNPQQQPDSATPDTFTDIQTQIKILQSQSLIERALDKTHISSVAELERAPEGTTPWLHFFSAPRASSGSEEALVEKAGKNLKVTAVTSTRIVELTYDAADPELAARFANALTTEFIAQNLQARWDMNRKTSDWLVTQVDEFRGKLQQSEDKLQAYAREKGLLYTGGDKQIVSEEKLRDLQTELSKAEADRVQKQSRFEIARSTTPGSVPEVMNDGNLRSMESNLVDLRKQEAEMAVTFKPDYSKSKALHAEIESLEGALNSKRDAIVVRLDNELQESQRREALLTSAYARQTRLVAGDSEKSIQYDMLKHDVDTNRQIYQLMLQRVKESSIASALKATNVRIVDSAKAPRHPYKPQPPMSAAAGLVAGLLLGICVIVVRSKADSTLQEPGDAGLLLGVPELGVIPSLAPGAALFSARKADGKSLQLASNITQSSKTADSFRAVLASIFFAGARQHQRVLVVTSASPGEGKTTTTSNLAITLAKMGRKVLLIDGDIRSPRIHNILGLNNSSGLTTMLKQIGINEALTENCIQDTSVPNLHALTSGPAVQAGADLLFSTSMAALVARYRNEYDMILIDTAPMLVMPDARALGRVADAVVLVARAGKTTRSAIQAACMRFLEDRTPVMGVILNDWDAKLSAYKYYSASYKEPAVDLVVKPKPAGAQ